MKDNKIANGIGTVALLGGILYAMRKNKGLAVTLVYGLGFGIAGMYIGNQIQKTFVK